MTNETAAVSESEASIARHLREHADAYAKHPAMQELEFGDVDLIREADDDELAALSLEVGAVELRAMMADVAERSAAVAVYGMRGLGKSTLLEFVAAWIAVHYPQRRVVFFDVLGTHDPVAGFEVVTVSGVNDARLLSLPVRAWLRLTDGAVLPTGKQLESLWRRVRNVVLLVDEGGIHEVVQSLRDCALTGRNHKVGLVVNAQRWTGTHPDLRRNVHWTLSTRVKGSEDIAQMEKESGARGWGVVGDLDRGEFVIANEQRPNETVWATINVRSDAVDSLLGE